MASLSLLPPSYSAPTSLSFSPVIGLEPGQPLNPEPVDIAEKMAVGFELARCRVKQKVQSIYSVPLTYLGLYE